MNEVLKRLATETPEKIIEEMESAVHAFAEGLPSEDDITLVALRFREN
jgi:serine phosphatase RsbU (regulator of sigma subunit)